MRPRASGQRGPHRQGAGAPNRAPTGSSLAQSLLAPPAPPSLPTSGAWGDLEWGWWPQAPVCPPCPHLPVQEGEGTGGEGPSWLLHWLRGKSQRGSSAWAGRAEPTVLPGEPPCCCPAGAQCPWKLGTGAWPALTTRPSQSDYWFPLRYTTHCACVTGAGSFPGAPQAVTLPSTGTGSSTEGGRHYIMETGLPAKPCFLWPWDNMACSSATLAGLLAPARTRLWDLSARNSCASFTVGRCRENEVDHGPGPDPQRPFMVTLPQLWLSIYKLIRK